ncbi:Spy0128 family protein [uncultured Clostridium sp.]|uniref:Spy0128 family protein n=1 Tax=uncultured Clostridium sp. TaxID=59620 RepID=UPI0025FDFCA0|nr:FctA domain-containing protein [uncultured Clostridium sp.]
MGKKNKVALMLVITLLFNIFYTSNVFATNLNTNILSVLKINSMITDINSVVNLSANDEVELDIKYTNSNKNIQAGDEVNIDLPLNFKNVKINYEPEYFTSNPVIDSQNVYTLTLNDKAVDSSEINISIIGTILEVEELVNDSIVVNIGQEKVNIAVNIESSTDKVSGNIDEIQNTNEVKEDSEKIDAIQNSTEVTDEVLGISEIDECEEITKSSIEFEAINVLDATKKLTEEYKSKNTFRYVKDGIEYTTPAFDFHIFSTEAILSAHTNGNIATKDLDAGGQGFGASQSSSLKLNEENYIQNSADNITQIKSDGNVVIGNKIPTQITDNGNKVSIGIGGTGLQNIEVYKEEQGSKPYINIDAELDNLKKISKALSDNPTSSGVKLGSLNGENQEITTDGNSSFYYLNIKANEISDGNNKRNLKINIAEGQTLIINVDMTGVDKDYLANLVTKINDHGNTEQVIGKENNVLWNLYDSLREDKLFTTSDYAKVGTGDYFMGTILAPNANIEYGALNGNLIANKVKNDGQESHKWDFTGKLEDSKSTSVILEGTKNLTGKDLTEGMFEFKVLDKDKDNNVVSTGKNDKDGNINFEAINYTEAGTYTYKVKEVVGELGGITYDTTEFEVTVTVVDNGNGQLVATVNYPKGGIEFNNKYSSKGTGIKLTATKNLTGKDLTEGMFEFKVVDENNKEVASGKNDEKGSIVFSEIKYNEVGSHTYTVKEVKGTLGGVTYDETTFEVKVEVSDDGQGNLVAKATYPEGGVVFNNEYEAKATAVTLEATKKLTGKDLTEGMFEFKVLDKDKDNNVVSTGKNDKDGNINFEAINYTEAGTYTYKVKEVVGELGGITYDTTEFEVTVTVVDNGNGQLVATVNYPKGGIEFSNKYTKKNVINTTTNKNNTPKTGDNGYGYILGIVLLAVGALLINNKRKKVQN